MDNTKLTILAVMVILSLVGRQHIELDIGDHVKHQPLFKLLVIYSIMFVNTRDYYISLLGTGVAYMLIKSQKIIDKSHDLD